MKQKRSTSIVKLFAVFALSFITFLALQQGALAATYVVTNTNDSGPGSLRQAMLEANGVTSGPDQIDFNIPGEGPHTITLTSGNLPFIIEQVTINGLSQPGSVCDGTNTMPAIRIDFNGVANPLVVNAGLGTEINGLALAGAAQNSSALALETADNIVRCNFFGTFDGNTNISTNINSDYLRVNSPGTQVGGPEVTDFNLFLGSGNSAIGVLGAGNASGLLVQNNAMGVTLDGSTAVESVGQGIAFSGSGTTITVKENHIGSANGIGFEGTASGSSNINIENNIIGTDRSGLTAFAGTNRAISFSGDYSVVLIQENIAATTASGQSAIITNGPLSGVSVINNNINVSSDGTSRFIGAGSGSRALTIAQAQDWIITENIMYGNSGPTLSLENSTNIAVTSNIIGMNYAKNLCFADQNSAISITGGDDTVIGGPSSSEANAICTDGVAHGVSIASASLNVSVLRNDIRAGGDVINTVATTALNAPKVRLATEVGGSTTIPVEIDVPAGQYRIEFFENSSMFNADGYAKADEFIGFAVVASDGTGPQTFTSVIPGTGFSNITATVTEIDTSDDGFGNTSPVGTLELQADLEVSTNDGVESVLNGTDNHEITQTITNFGPSTITDIDFILTASDCFSINTVTLGGTATDTGSYTSLSWSGVLAPNQTLELVFTGDIACSAPATITFTHTLSDMYSNSDIVTDSNDSNHDYTNTTTINSPVTDLSIAKKLLNPEDVEVGGILNYSITLTNNGPQPLDLSVFDGSGPNPFQTNLFIDILPGDLNFVSDSSTNSNIECAVFAPATAAGPLLANHADGDVVTCAYDGSEILTSGQSITTTISAEVDAGSDLKFANSVMTGWAQYDPDTTVLIDPFGANEVCNQPSEDILDCYKRTGINNYAETVPVAEIEVTSAFVQPVDAKPGASLSYDVTIKNNGPMDIDLAEYDQGFLNTLYPGLSLSLDDVDDDNVACTDLGFGTAVYMGVLAQDHSSHNLVVCGYSGVSRPVLVGESYTLRFNFTVLETVENEFTAYSFANIPGGSGFTQLEAQANSATGDILDSVSNPVFSRLTYSIDTTDPGDGSDGDGNQSGDSPTDDAFDGTLSSTGQSTKVIVVFATTLLILSSMSVAALKIKHEV